MKYQSGNHTHTTSIIERLLIADLDSHTIKTNRKQLKHIKGILERFECALDENERIKESPVIPVISVYTMKKV